MSCDDSLNYMNSAITYSLFLQTLSDIYLEMFDCVKFYQSMHNQINFAYHKTITFEILGEKQQIRWFRRT